jgi:hypothetical protein
VETHAKGILRYAAKLRERYPMMTDVAIQTLQGNGYVFKTKIAFGTYMFLAGYDAGLADGPRTCRCDDIENLLVWVDLTQEYSGVTLNCRSCGREVPIKTVRELEEVDDDINGPPNGAANAD